MYTNHEKYALVNGVMLDGTRDMTPRTRLAVCVDGDRIAAVCDAADVPEGYARVDLGGKYLLPGLINLHVHLPASGKPRKKPSDPKKLVKLITSNGLMRRIGVKMCEGYARTELLSGVTTIRTVGGVADFDTIIRDAARRGPGWWRPIWRCRYPAGTWPGRWPMRPARRRRPRPSWRRSRRKSPT